MRLEIYQKEQAEQVMLDQLRHFHKCASAALNLASEGNFKEAYKQFPHRSAVGDNLEALVNAQDL